MNDLGWQIRKGLNDYVKNQTKSIYECDVCGVKYTNYKAFDKHIMWREFYNDEEYCK
tara:strand:+ start:7183 stop:7353 length:171 start_codon:yes stop_codon:yes gene_type:complete